MPLALDHATGQQPHADNPARPPARCGRSFPTPSSTCQRVGSIPPYRPWAIGAVCLVWLILVRSACALDIEPRAYTNTPVGLNFLAVGYQRSEGGLEFDPALPITDASATVDTGLLGYVRTLGVAGRSAKIGFKLPYSRFDAHGYVAGEFRSREQSGLADPTLYFTVNLSGAPALSLQEFKSYRQDLITGFTLKVTAPLGAYDDDYVLNIGTNRWSFEPELGVSKALGRWILEAAGSIVFYTDNEDFEDGSTRSQDPIYSARGDVIYNFPDRVWLAFGATFFTGGRTTVDGTTSNDLADNWRAGAVLTVPVDRKNSIKIYGSSGISTRTGADYDTVGLLWQYLWGDGL